MRARLQRLHVREARGTVRIYSWQTLLPQIRRLGHVRIRRDALLRDDSTGASPKFRANPWKWHRLVPPNARAWARAVPARRSLLRVDPQLRVRLSRSGDLLGKLVVLNPWVHVDPQERPDRRDR